MWGVYSLLWDTVSANMGHLGIVSIADDVF